jgi:hypothetical protein
MNALAPTDPLRLAHVAVGLSDAAEAAARRSGLAVDGSRRVPVQECTCPHDCDRDHPNE